LDGIFDRVPSRQRSSDLLFSTVVPLTAPDAIQPDPRQWKICSLAAGTREPLLVRFREPLDHAMLQRVLRVVNPDKALLGGEIQIVKGETKWAFQPDARWEPGRHQLRISR